jgi:hypothetical protein
MSEKPPAASKAALRTIAAQDMKPRIDGPGRSGRCPSGLSASIMEKESS